MPLPTAKWRPLIADACAYAGIADPATLEAMVLVESGGDPNARSASNAIGLGQIMPRWHRMLIKRVQAELEVAGSHEHALFDPQVNLYVAARHLAWCIRSCGSVDRGVARYHSGQCDPPADFVDGQGTSTTYHVEKFVTALADVRAAIGVPNAPEDSAVSMKEHHFIGSSVSYYLPDDILVEIRIVDHPRVRSYQKHHDQYISTVHDTGNPNTNADDEYRFLANGRPGVGAGGYNFITDSRKIIQCVPLNETTWHAGTSKGNHYSWGTEMAYGGGQDFDRVIEVNAALHGALLAAQGWNTKDNLVLHQYWYGKWCAAQILNRGIWPDFQKKVAAFQAKSAAAAIGEELEDTVTDEIGDAVDGWPYPDPVPPSFWDQLLADGATHVEARDGTMWYRVSTLYRVSETTARQQFAIEDDRVVGPELATGATFRAVAVGQSFSDKQAWCITPQMTRIPLSDLEYVTDQEPLDTLTDALDDVVNG